jgi:hypothetical protein
MLLQSGLASPSGSPATWHALQAELAPEKLARRHAGAMLALGRLHEGLIGVRGAIEDYPERNLL